MYYAYLALRIALYPFVVFGLGFFSKALKSRLEFERKNLRSDERDAFQADFAFHVSSEGELEQVRYLIEKKLQQNKRIELIYTSPSVESACLKLENRWKERLISWRLPVLSFFPGTKKCDPSVFLTAPVLYLCRYDFLPELLAYKNKKRCQQLILLSGSAKSLRPRNKKFSLGTALYRLYLIDAYKRFDKLVVTSKADREVFCQLGIAQDKVKVFDFRPLMIEQRLMNAHKTLRERLPRFTDFLKLAQSYAKHRRFIFGSFWPLEAQLFAAQEVDVQKNLFCFFPHQLDSAHIQELELKLNRYAPNIALYFWTEDEDQVAAMLEAFERRPGFLIFTVRGILCEIYQHFSTAYVGGGFGVSVHSLLEPYIAGAKIYCGPKIERSTEYDLIRAQTPKALVSVDRYEKLFDHLMGERDYDVKREQILARYHQDEEEILRWLEQKGAKR